MKFRIASIAALTLALSPAHALAASSDWHHADGASLRIVTSDRPDADGRLRGALEIRLRPGWKTYWIDPGDAGVPPTLTLGDGSTVDVAFPAPKRFDDGYSVWAGYDRPLALALTFETGAGEPPATMEAEAFLGLCETICIPVQASFTFDLAADASEPQDEAIVADAFAALPAPARAGFEARTAEANGEAIEIDVEAPDGAEIVDLFIASDGRLGAARRTGAAAFSVPILHGGDRLPAALPYTLVTSVGAVSGMLER